METLSVHKQNWEISSWVFDTHFVRFWDKCGYKDVKANHSEEEKLFVQNKIILNYSSSGAFMSSTGSYKTSIPYQHYGALWVVFIYSMQHAPYWLILERHCCSSGTFCVPFLPLSHLVSLLTNAGCGYCYTSGSNTHTHTHNINSDVMQVFLAQSKNSAVASDWGKDPLIEDKKLKKLKQYFATH